MRAVIQPLLCSATGLPEGARYFGCVVASRPPATDATSSVPNGRAIVHVADLIGQPREFAGRQWWPVPGAAAEVLELIDVATGQLLTVVRAPFRAAEPRALSASASEELDPPPEPMSASLRRAARPERRHGLAATSRAHRRP